MFKLVYTKNAKRDILKINHSHLGFKVRLLLELIKENPYQTPPPYEKLLGDLSGAYSRRINIQHRLVYQIYEKEKIIKIISLWNHYE